jgi:hypothetical protein
MRALLIPKRQLTGELRILIYACFNLKRAVNEPGFWEVVDD